MFLLGWSWPELAALFGAMSTAVVALYLLRTKRRAVAVPFAQLWQRVLSDKDATHLFAKLKKLLSMLLQLLLLALLVLALGDPRLAGNWGKGRTLVVLIDASASMQAHDVAPSRIEVARREVRNMIQGLGGADRMLIAQMDAAVTPLGPMSGDAAELNRALDALRPTDAHADFARAVRFAVDALRGEERSEIVVVSDGRLGQAEDGVGLVHLGATKLTFVSIGQGGDNLGLTQFAVRRYPVDKNRYEVMLEVTNTGASDAAVELSLLGDGQVVDLATLRLKAGERLPRFYPNLSGANRKLEAVIKPIGGARDELAIDDHAYAVLPTRRRVRVLVVTEGNTYLEAALLLDEYLDVTQLLPVAFDPAKSTTGIDAVIFDGVTPAEHPRIAAFYIDPRGPGAPVQVGDAIAHPTFDTLDRKHPLLQFVSLDDVNIARARRLIPQAGDRVVGRSADLPILVSGNRDGSRFVALGFDVRESDLPLRIAWPLFVIQCVHWLTDEEVHEALTVRTGDVWRIPTGAEDPQAIVALPNGQRETVPVRDGRAILFGQHAGFYELSRMAGARFANADHSETILFAGNLLDADESAILPAKSLTVDGREAGALAGFHPGIRRELWIALVLVVIAIATLEWATYHRRVTV